MLLATEAFAFAFAFANVEESAKLFDIADDFSKSDRRNHTLNHMMERVKIYSQENFNYEIIPINFRRNQ